MDTEEKVDVRELVKAFAAAHPQWKVTGIGVPFHGYGDSGEADYHSLYCCIAPSPTGASVVMDADADAAARTWRDGALGVAMALACEHLLCEHRSGWEINDGSSGNLEVMVTGDCYLDFAWNETVENPDPLVIGKDNGAPTAPRPGSITLAARPSGDMVGLDPQMEIVVNFEGAAPSGTDLMQLQTHLNEAYQRWVLGKGRA